MTWFEFRVYFPALTNHQLQIIPLRFYLLHQAIGVFPDWLSITLLLLPVNRKKFLYVLWQFQVESATFVTDPCARCVVPDAGLVLFSACQVDISWKSFAARQNLWTISSYTKADRAAASFVVLSTQAQPLIWSCEGPLLLEIAKPGVKIPARDSAGNNIITAFTAQNPNAGVVRFTLACREDLRNGGPLKISLIFNV